MTDGGLGHKSDCELCCFQNVSSPEVNLQKTKTCTHEFVLLQMKWITWMGLIKLIIQLVDDTSEIISLPDQVS